MFLAIPCHTLYRLIPRFYYRYLTMPPSQVTDALVRCHSDITPAVAIKPIQDFLAQAVQAHALFPV